MNSNPRPNTNYMFDLDFTGNLVLVYLYQKVNACIISKILQLLINKANQQETCPTWFTELNVRIRGPVKEQTNTRR